MLGIEMRIGRSGREIRNLPFHHEAKPTLGLELFRLQELFARADERPLDHGLETPQRPEFHTVYLGIRGAGHLLVDFAPVPLGANQLVFVARGRVQQFIIDRTVDAWMVLVEPQLALGPGGEQPAVLSPAWDPPGLAVAPPEHRELLGLVDQIAAEQTRPLDAHQPAILAALFRALVLRCDRIRGVDAPHGATLAQFFTMLDRDCTRTRAVADYARAIGISPRRLGELLVAHTGKSTKQVIDERVLLEQKRQLAFTEVTVKALAVATGFDEPTNLVKFFKHHTGKTPLEFREEQRTFLPSVRRSPLSRNRRR